MRTNLVIIFLLFIAISSHEYAESLHTTNRIRSSSTESWLISEHEAKKFLGSNHFYQNDQQEWRRLRQTDEHRET